MFPRLLLASSAMHAADQLSLAAVPLIAAAAGADAATVGFLVAAQSAAWLIVSLPAGALADRLSRRALVMGGAWLAIAGAGLAAFAAYRQASLLLLGLACFVMAAGVVAVILSVFALTPRALAAQELPRGNARLELARAAATLAAPSLVAWLVSRGLYAAVFALAVACGVAALLASRGLPREAQMQKGAPMLAAIRDGARFVAAHPALRAVALCAIFWNMAFFALAGLFVPLATTHLAMDATAIGRVWSAMGAGLVLGAFSAPAISARCSLRALLLFGPAVSMLAGALIAISSRATPEPLLWLAFFLVGFGPILWAVTQTSLRQRVTPPALMGRVGATMQVATWGARPLGALLAGWAGARFGIVAAAAIPALLFAASFLAMLALASAATRERAPSPA